MNNQELLKELNKEKEKNKDLEYSLKYNVVTKYKIRHKIKYLQDIKLCAGAVNQAICKEKILMLEELLEEE